MQLKEGTVAYPVLTDSADCPKCREKINLLQLRQQIESQFGKRWLNKMAEDRFKIIFGHMDKEITEQTELQTDAIRNALEQITR